MAYAYYDNDKWNEVTEDFSLNGIDYSFSTVFDMPLEDLAEVGIRPIEEELVTVEGERKSREIVDVEGIPTWHYEIVPIIDYQAIAMRKQAIEARIMRAFNKGFAPSHPAFENERLQCRDDSDRTNWLVAEKEYTKAVVGNYGDVLGADFRTQSNRTVTVTFSEAIQVLSDLTAWGIIIMKRGWTIKDAEKAGEPYDLEAGWPV